MHPEQAVESNTAASLPLRPKVLLSNSQKPPVPPTSFTVSYIITLRVEELSNFPGHSLAVQDIYLKCKNNSLCTQFPVSK